MVWSKHAARGSSRGDRDRAAWEMVRRQHGVLTRADLVALGFRARAASSTGVATRAPAPDLARRLRRGTARADAPRALDGGGPRLRGRGGAQPPQRGRSSGGSATRSGDGSTSPSGGSTKIRRKGLKVRSRPSLGASSSVAATASRSPHPVQTLIDLATELKPLRLERAVNEADKLDLVDPETLRRALDGHKGEPGVKKLATLLDRHTFRLSDSDLEVLFRPLALARGPSPPADQTVGPRLRGRLLLPRPRPDRRDRRPPLPPHPVPTGPRRQTRPDPHRRRPPRPALHPLADRPRPRRGDRTSSAASARTCRR